MTPRLKAVVLDWAGTIVDFGSRAALAAIQRTFELNGIAVAEREIRQFMGIGKRDHLAAVASLPRIAYAWRLRHGAPPDAGRLYAQFLELQAASAADYSDVLPWVPVTIDALLRRGFRIGATTSYSRGILSQIEERAMAQGCGHTLTVTSDEVPAGRPAPWMCFRLLQMMDVYPPAACVKVGDTVADIEEGLNAGMWSVGVLTGGNEIGLGADGWASLPEAQRHAARESARATLLGAGAHFVVDTLADLPLTLDLIESRLAAPAHSSPAAVLGCA